MVGDDRDDFGIGAIGTHRRSGPESSFINAWEDAKAGELNKAKEVSFSSALPARRDVALVSEFLVEPRQSRQAA
jgi:hypothetical protein